jgi:hypothetical protein
MSCGLPAGSEAYAGEMADCMQRLDDLAGVVAVASGPFYFSLDLPHQRAKTLLSGGGARYDANLESEVRGEQDVGPSADGVCPDGAHGRQA